MHFTTESLKALVVALLRDKAAELSQYDARRYNLDVVDDGLYKNLTRKREVLRVQRFQQLASSFDATAEADAERVAQHRDLLAGLLRTRYLARANTFLKAMAQRADKGTRAVLAAVLKEHASSDDAKLFAYLTLVDLIECQDACEEPVAGSEDRFRDEVAMLYEECDSPEQLGALLKSIQLPTERELGKARAKAYAA